ncbi:MAG: PAS domain S-box protein [Methanofastidiosum sp.]
MIEGIFSAAPIGIGIVIDRVFVFVNDFLCNLLEYSKEELIGKNSRLVYSTDEEYEYVGKEKYGQLKKYITGTVETKFKTKSGKIIDIILSSSYIDRNIPSKGTIFTALDITERKSIEEKLKESELKYKRLYENLSACVAIYETKDNGNTFIIKGINKAGGEKSKVKLEEIKDKSVVEIFPSVKEIGLFDIFKKVYATGKPEYLPTRFYKDNRMSQWVENYVYKLSSGEIVAIYEDISERKLPNDFPTTYSFEYPKISNQALLTLII